MSSSDLSTDLGRVPLAEASSLRGAGEQTPGAENEHPRRRRPRPAENEEDELARSVELETPHQLDRTV